MRDGKKKDLPTCRYFLALLHEIIAEKTLAGYRLKTEFFETGLSIRGTFGSVDDEFDPKRHKVLPTVCTTKAFKAAVAAAEVVNVSKPLKAKVISLMDAVTKSLNAFTGSHEIHMQGDYLGICPDNPDEGVFLVAKGKTVAEAEVLKSDAQIINCRFADPPPPGKYDKKAFAPIQLYHREDLHQNTTYDPWNSHDGTLYHREDLRGIRALRAWLQTLRRRW